MGPRPALSLSLLMLMIHRDVLGLLFDLRDLPEKGKKSLGRGNHRETNDEVCQSRNHLSQ
jgi:hypothetical protein